MDEHKYIISVGQEVIARDVPEAYVVIIVRAVLLHFHHFPNISVIISRQQEG